MSSKQDWVDQLVIEEGIDNTGVLSRDIIHNWCNEYNETFESNITEESFKRMLRKARWNNSVVVEKLATIEPIRTEREDVGRDLQIVAPKTNMGNILFIADIHEPFSLKGYLEFCVAMQKKHNCNTIVFSGDIMDMHMSSYHESDSDGDYTAGFELNEARTNLQKWYKAFPEAYVCLGNHDQISNRKAFSSGLSKQWIKPISEVLNTPNWIFSDEFIFDEVKYTHGTGMKARQRAKSNFISICQGHYHSESYVDYYVGHGTKIFALQVGAGINYKSYAFAYAKNFNKPHVNVGVIKENGKLPLLEYMDLKRDYTL